MKLFSKSYDGGQDSGVTSYFLIEWKSCFSIALLHFTPDYRENYHSHAFNALTWGVRGEAIEEFKDKPNQVWTPSVIPKYTPRTNMHRYKTRVGAWAFTIRGPWNKTWEEYSPTSNKYITLGLGRKILNIEEKIDGI